MRRLQVVFFLTYTLCCSAQSDGLIYQIKAYDCTSTKKVKKSTGFSIRKNYIRGILTTLHGVCGCGKIIAIINKDEIIRNLKIKYIDISADIAVLDAVGYQDHNRYFNLVDHVEWEQYSSKNVLVTGYPLGSPRPRENQVRIRSKTKEYFGDVLNMEGVVAPQTYRAMKRRKSPSFELKVLDIDGALVPGLSGSPITFGNTLLGVANGGVSGGVIPYTWGIPVDEIELKYFALDSQLSDLYKFLEQESSGVLFGNESPEQNPIVDIQLKRKRKFGNILVEYFIQFQDLIKEDTYLSLRFGTEKQGLVQDIKISRGEKYFMGSMILDRDIEGENFEFKIQTTHNEYIKLISID